jgi:MoaA/NifB/PqqE/SkfB family radical SAM enzyme
MITSLDLNLLAILTNPRTLFHLGKIWWLRNRVILKGHKHHDPTDFKKIAKDFEYLRKEKITKFGDKYIVNSYTPPFPSKAFEVYTLRGLDWPVGYPTYPDSVNLAVTSRCPMNCWHCSSANRGKQHDLSTNEWIRIIDELQAVNVSYIGFTGGEPLLRDDLEQIISHIDSRSVVILDTCGAGLTLKRAQGLKKAGLFYVSISIDHYKPEVHDKKRGLKGAFNFATQAITSARSAGLYTIAQTVYSRDSAEEGVFWKMLDLSKQLGAHEFRVVLVRPSGRLINRNSDSSLTAQQDLELRGMCRQANLRRGYPKVSLLDDFESPTLFGCSAGSQHGYIDAVGNVYPCDFVPLNFGNLTKESFVNVWARVHQALGKSQRECLARVAANHIVSEIDNSLPIPLEKSILICERCKTDELPDHFKR